MLKQEIKNNNNKKNIHKDNIGKIVGKKDENKAIYSERGNVKMKMYEEKKTTERATIRRKIRKLFIFHLLYSAQYAFNQVSQTLK